MPHADSALVPSSVATKQQFWGHVHEQLSLVLDGQNRNWVSNLSTASALLYHSLRDFTAFFGAGDRAVNWCGFYLIPELFPGKKSPLASDRPPPLLLGPFHGKPACQWIPLPSSNTPSSRPLGVCAAAFVSAKPLLVPDVDAYPGHIACDGDTKSEVVLPLIQHLEGKPRVLGVLDLDCLALGGFSEEDAEGLEKIAQLLVASCDWE
ncbi:hypothetical protein BOTBODRAFT_178270 [Botryobasidium botryosum FD-172 SS1]|uniref:GAF domain-containing protein n=1 Tax=Botryobasidium botryosum (strain FD-172 SS1) TaxID=930990 RepID=A0A067MF52_BOTB1|nr:hypothetical protein BOTBODRAFT_178270 [Botryobasidium botryosum FD-172 SS1]